MDETQPTDRAAPSTPPRTSAISGSSPPKPATAHVNIADRAELSKSIGANRDNYKEIDVSMMIKKLCPDGEDIQWLEAKSKTVSPPTSTTLWSDYLKTLSAEIPPMGFTISFLTCGNTPPKFHPTGTDCKPDRIAYKEVAGKTRNLGDIEWSHVEATVEDKSTGTPKHSSLEQAAAYTVYNLQARPDLVSVAGLWIDGAEFTILFTNASIIYRSQPRTAEEKQRLMLAFMWYLYHPISDPTVIVNMESSPTTFKVTTPKEYGPLFLLRAGPAIGRRTTIFAHQDPQNTRIIKEQYINPRRRFKEGDILSKIHQGRDFPGVVRLESFGEVKDDQGDKIMSSPDRVKTRLVLKDKGSPFKEIRTFREMVTLSYDLLEVIRMLYRKRKVLHRDISSGNILFREETKPNIEVDDGFFEDMCFINCLLGKAKDVSQPSIADRLTTTVLLADFDHGEDKENPSTAARIERTGTPMFMAVALRNGGPQLTPEFCPFPAMPPIHEKIQSRYQELLPDRLEKRWDDGPEIRLDVQGEKFGDKFEHLLRHDVESVFWCMLWWSILAKPEGYIGADSTLDPATWANLIASLDHRYDNFIIATTRLPVHPDYAAIIDLLDSMRAYLRTDLHYSRNVTRRDSPEYLCEAFQRLILKFLVEKEGKKFLDSPKDAKWRDHGDKQKGTSTTTAVGGTGVKRSRQQIESEQSGDNRKAKKGRVQETS